MGVLGGVGLSKLSVFSDVGVLGCVGLSELSVLGWVGLSFGVLSSGVSVIPRLRLGLGGHESVVIQVIYCSSCLPILSLCGHRCNPSYFVSAVTLRRHDHWYSLRFFLSFWSILRVREEILSLRCCCFAAVCCRCRSSLSV